MSALDDLKAWDARVAEAAVKERFNQRVPAYLGDRSALARSH
ncbi:hypothetical protein [Baekduia soli]|nr:hypothetical protein [Baekduia soli]